MPIPVLRLSSIGGKQSASVRSGAASVLLSTALFLCTEAKKSLSMDEGVRYGYVSDRISPPCDADERAIISGSCRGWCNVHTGGWALSLSTPQAPLIGVIYLSHYEGRSIRYVAISGLFVPSKLAFTINHTTDLSGSKIRIIKYTSGVVASSAQRSNSSAATLYRI